VRTFQSHLGTPTGAAVSQPLQIKIPATATAVDIWFHNYNGAGSSCQAWDSNFGFNYRYEIWPPASHPRCKNVERWSTWNSDMPYRSVPHCLAYATPDQQVAANHCELYLSGIGDGYMGHYGIPNRWVEVYLTVGPQEGTLLGAGLWTRYRDPASNSSGERFTTGRKIAPDLWQSGFIYHHPGVMGSGAYHYEVEQMAFFIDVRRPSGDLVRIWQSRQGANYSWSDAFALPRSSKPIPYGSIQYADPASPIFDAGHACGL
jgi:hypothetical protein